MSPQPELYQHQKDWRVFSEEKQATLFNGDMGVGKTGAAIDALKSHESILVVCPIAVGRAWVKQFSIWDPSRRVILAVDGPSAKRAEAVSRASGRFAVIVNYDAVWRQKLGLAIERTGWSAIVLDESHRIKSPSGKASRWLSKLAQKQPNAKRICLTGTPTPHSPLDWWSQFRFLDPSVLGGSYTAYRSRIAKLHPKFPGMVLAWNDEALKALAERIDPYVFRVKADEVLTLPEAVHIEVPVILSPQVRRYYDSLEEELVAKLDSGEIITVQNKLSLVLRLQQATSGIATNEDGEVLQVDGEPQKIATMLDWLQDLPTGEPFVIFCRFLSDIDHSISGLTARGITCSELSGRRKQLEQWQAGETQAIVVQQQAGGTGIDLTRASVAIYVSLSHSLGDYEQSLARLRRPGQSRTCRYVHLIAQTSVDESVYESLSSKRDVVESVLTRLSRRVLS